MTTEARKTPMYDSHVARGGQMVDFAGWSLPVRFGNLREEHLHVRSQVGIFDVSHMGEFRVQGPKALATLQAVTTNDVSRLQAGEAQYSLLSNTQGGIVDDLIIYCIEPNQDYLLCVNGANIEKDFRHIQTHNLGADLVDQSQDWGLIAVQGPLAMGAMEKIMSEPLELKSFCFRPWSYKGHSCFVARTGYTGEDGVEVFVPTPVAKDLWEQLLTDVPEALPIGLGARDTLRTEMKFPLYGQDIDDNTSPFESGLGWVVKLDKGEFLGREAMAQVKEQGAKTKWVGLEVKGPGIARPGCPVFSVDSEQVGVITSGTLSPSLNKAIATARLKIEQASVGQRLLIQVRNKKMEAEVVKTPFYKKS